MTLCRVKNCLTDALSVLSEVKARSRAHNSRRAYELLASGELDEDGSAPEPLDEALDEDGSAPESGLRRVVLSAEK